MAAGGANSRADLKERAFAALMALKERLGNLSTREKAEILRILVPGGPDCKVVVKKSGEVTIHGAIDFEKVTNGAVTSTVSHYVS